MTTAELWTTEELPGLSWDPEPDEDDDGPWCRHPDLWGNGITAEQLHAMTTVPTPGDLL